MRKEQIIQINVMGGPGVGKSTVAYLLADFLSHTGFKTELNLLEPMFDAAAFEQTFPAKLEAIENKGTCILINEVASPPLFGKEKS